MSNDHEHTIPEPVSVPSAPASEHPITVAAAARNHNRQFLWWAKFVGQPVMAVLLLIFLVIALGWAQRFGYFNSDQEVTKGPDTGDEVLYICPMVCVPPTTEPGKCPVCGMELKAKKSSGDSKDKYGLRLDAASIRVANITTVAATSEPLVKKLRAIGEISYDEGSLATISAYVDGRIEKLFADYTGVNVRDGDELALLYSPDLYSSQVALLESIKLADQANTTNQRIGKSNKRLYESSRQRLLELGLTEKQVNEIEEKGTADSRVRIVTPISGTVIEKMAAEGQYVKAGQPIYKVADLTTVWLMLELFPRDAAKICFGQKVVTKIQSFPGKEIVGRVAFIDPTVDSKTQTVRVRVVIPNVAGLIRIGDFATASIIASANSPADQEGAVYDPDLVGKWISPRHPHVISDGPGKCTECGMDLVPASEFGFVASPTDRKYDVVVPRSAVLMAGEESVVYVETEPGRFEFRQVEIGQIVGDQVSIVKGVKSGEQVVASATMLVDSQFNMSGKPSLIDPYRATPRALPEIDGVDSSELMAALSELTAEQKDEVFSQKICPVAGEALGSMGPPLPVIINGRTVWICCSGCKDGLLENPEKYLAILDKAASADREQTQKINEAMAALSDEDRKLALAQKTCPVANMPLGSMGTPIKVDVNGQPVFVCCEGCRQSLLDEPEKYLKILANGPDQKRPDQTPSELPKITPLDNDLPEIELPKITPLDSESRIEGQPSQGESIK